MADLLEADAEAAADDVDVVALLLRRLPLLRGRAEGLPAELDALLVTSDLQGRARAGDGQLRLLGEALASLVVQRGELH